MGSFVQNSCGHLSRGVLLRNQSGTTISSITLAYTGEQWRDNVAAAQTLTVWYRVSPTSISALEPGVGAGWTQVPALTFTSPQNSNTGASGQGNNASWRTVFSATALPSISVPDGHYVMIKWDDINDPGLDHMLAIDDVTIAWTVFAGCVAPTLDAKFNGVDAPAVCSGAPGTLTANAIGGGGCSGSFEYAWYTGDGTGNTYWDGNSWDNPETYGAFATITGVVPPATTTYKVKLRCSTDFSCANEDATGVTVTVNAPPTTSNAGFDQTQCGNSSFTLAGNTPLVGTGTWSLVSGSATISTPGSPTSAVTGVAAGTSATMRWTISNPGCTSSFDDVVLSNGHAPAVPSLTPPSGAYCVSGSIDFTALATAAGPGVLTSPFVGGALFKASGSGAWDTYPGTISVSGLDITNTKVRNVALSNFNGQPSNVDILLQSPTGVNVILMADAGGIFSVTGRNYVFQDGAPSFNDASGTYRPTSGDGFDDNFPAPGPGAINQGSPALSNFTGNPNGTWRLFAVNDGSHTASIGSWSITFEVPDLSYSWSPAIGLNTTSGAAVTASPSTTTTYTVTVTNNQGGCTNTNTATVTVYPLPIVDAGNYGPFCSVDDDVDLVGDPPGGVWTGTGVTGSGPYIFDPSVGTQTLTYEYTDGNGCSNSDDVTITVIPATTWYLDQDGDGFGDPANPLDACDQPSGYVANSDDNCPDAFGMIGDYCDALGNDPNQFQLGQLDANCDCTPVPTDFNVVLEMRTPDASSNEISWEIELVSANLTICSGGAYGAGNSFPIVVSCGLVDNECYRLRVFDSAGDGFGTNGGYQLRLTGANPADIRIIDNTGNFNSGIESSIGSGPNTFCFPMSTQKPIFVSREKLDWVSNEYFVCEPDNAVSNVWLTTSVGDPARANSGYQFWFFDPNGSYSFRRGRHHNTSDGFGPANEFRACHMRINNWVVANQIPANVLMNVRVRTRVNGVYGNFGPAYRFMIDPVAAACPLTKLNDIPDQPALSCNSSRNWGAGNFVHARQVSGANRYQFRFRIPSENFIVVVSSNTYFLQLNWATNALEPGKTYEVQARASKDGGSTWCASGAVWGPSCTLFINNLAQDEEQNLGLKTTTTGSLALWPNPNRGDQLWVDLSGIEAGVESVSVDILDLSGKQIVARIIPTSFDSAQDGDRLNTVLDLQGDLATGMYLVNITAGEKRYTERLVVAQ